MQTIISNAFNPNPNNSREKNPRKPTPPYFQIETRTITRLPDVSATDVQPSNWKNPGIQKAMKSNPQSHESHPYTTPADWRTSEDGFWPTCLLQKVQGPEDQLYGQKIDVAQLGHHNKLYRATASIVIN